ncbi:MAG: hypothetical protein ACOYKE_12160 [Ferruginibacter sp.]
MQKTNLIFRKLLLLSAFFFYAGQVSAQWNNGKYMKQAITRTLNYAKTYESSSSVYGFAKGLSFLGTYLDPTGGKSNFTIELIANKKYIFMGGGDDDATDVDIKITKNDKVIASDTKTDNQPFISYAPDETARYVLTLSNHASKGAYCCLVILESGGIALNTSRIDEAKNALFGTTSIVQQVSPTGVVFQSQNNSWCLFGYLIEQGAEYSIYGMPLRTDSKHYFVGVGDNDVRDIDICVNNSEDSDETCNKELDATPLVVLKKATATSYGFKIKNVKSDGRSFVLVSILRE